MSLLSKKAKTVTLFHGTCAENAKSLVQNGWQPNQVPTGGNAGQTRYLYLTSGYEDALWYAGEKGCDVVLKVTAPMDALAVDPEDGVGETVEEELNSRHGLPGKVVLTRPLPAANFSVVSQKTAKQYDNASTQINVPEEIAAEIKRVGMELIPDEHLAGDGRVEVIHITVKYGVQPDERLLRQAMAGFKSFPVELGKTMVFPEASTEGTPVVIEVHGHGFEELHKAVANAMGILPDEFPYTPHITVAYVTQVEAQHYAGRDEFAGIKFTAEAVTLSMFDDDNQVDVPLAKAAAKGSPNSKPPFWFQPGFDPKIQAFIMKNRFPNEGISCWDESYRWAEKLLRQGYDVDLYGGMYTGEEDLPLFPDEADNPDEWIDHGRMEGHTWLAVNGYIFDPTARQFNSEPDSDFYKDDSWEDAEELKRKFKIAAAQKWYHGTSVKAGQKILKDGVLRPGMPTTYKDYLLPRPDAVYITRDYKAARDYARKMDGNGMVIEVRVDDPSKLIPDEDAVNIMLASASRLPKDTLAKPFYRLTREVVEAAKAFEAATGKKVVLGESGWDELMKEVTEFIARRYPALSQEILRKSKDAAYLGTLKVVGGEELQDRELDEDYEPEEKQAASPAQVTPEIPQVRPQTPQQQEPEEDEEVQRDEPATPEQKQEQPKPKRPQPKLLQPKQPKTKPYKAPKPPAKNPDFKKWFGKSQVRDEDGKPMVVYHGTTHDFTTFDPSKGNVEAYYGKALYFTSDQEDVGSNYATETGPDITSRIERRYEQLQNEIYDLKGEELEEVLGEKVDENENIDALLKEKAKKDIAGQSKGLSMPVYLSIQNPVYVQKKGGTHFSIEFDEETEQESGNGVDLWNAMQLVAGNFEDADWQTVWEGVSGDMEFTAWDFEQQVRNTSGFQDPNTGDMASGEFISQVYQELGFDGIVLDAYGSTFFGPGGGGKMNMEYGTKHYILWDPTKVKSAIGNVGKFDPRNPNITASLPFKFYPITDEWIDRAKEFLKEKWAQRHTELQREGVPTDLKGACKFASIFAQKVFGGQIKGNPDHQVVKTPQRIIDLTDEFDPNTFRHDKEWFGNPEHEESMQSCMPRVNQWYEEFKQKYPPETTVTAAAKSKVQVEPLPKELTDDGWLTPDNKWIDTSLVPKHDHIWTAKQLGFKGVDPRQTAAEAGYTRVVIWMHVNEAIFMFASPLVARRKMPLLLKHLPAEIENVSVEESRGNMENYEIGDAWDRYVYGNSVTAADWDDEEFNDEPQTWEQFTTLQPGTTLYHGTSNEWEEGSELSFPAWFSTNKNVADWFAHRNGEGTPMIRMYRVSSPIQLVELVDKNDMQQFFEMYGIEDYGIETISEGTINAGFEGWYIPDNYRPGDDIMLGDGSKLEYMETHPASKKANRFISGVDPRIAATGVGDLGMARKIMHELMPVLGEPQLPEPELKIVNSPRAGWNGRDTWRIGIQNGQPIIGDNTVIELQKGILGDDNTLRRIIAHELCHHADSLVNGVEEMRKVHDKWTYESFLRNNRGHGAGWRAYAQKYNAKFGADFVTEKSDENIIVEELELRPFHILLERGYDGKLAYEVSSRMTAKQKRYLDRLASTKDGYEHRLTTTNDRTFYRGHLIGSFYYVHPKDEETQKKLEALWVQAKPIEPTGAAKEQDEILAKMKQYDWLNKDKKSAAPQLEDLEQAYEDQRSTSLPQIDKLEHGVTKDYDRVRWVYQQFYDNQIRSMSWKDFQKKFPWAQNSPLFTQVRQNRPQITLEDLDRWMEEYNTKAKEYQNYELEHDTYRDKDTSFRDVEQLVVRVNQSASAAEIIGEDEMLKGFLDQVQMGSQRSGHPVSKNTVGWLRVDFINDQWLLIDEVQSDLINAVDLAKRFIAEPSLASLMQGYKSETVKQKIQEMGATEAMFQNSKREFARRGYTPEKLEEMKQSLANLFKDWAEYGIASIIEIARRHGIKNIAIHTGGTIAQRDPDVEADKVGMYYDQIAKAFGFKKQQLDIGELKGEFWTRTASAKSNLKAWFDGSKVVDEKGNPRVVYHGSRSSWLTQFDLGREGTGVHGATKWGAIWFTSSAENAEEYADPKEEKVEADLDEIVPYGNDPFYAAVYDINGESLFQVGPHPTEEEAEREGLAQAKLYNQNLDKNTNVVGVYLKIVNPYITDKVPRDAEFKAAKQGGHDGIIAYDVVDGYTRSDVFVIFSPSQAKSAERNVGTYDPNSVSLTAGKRSEAVTSMTVGVNIEKYPDFPAPVLIRWEQGMRWREVLKVVKSIVGEVAGKRVAWRDIYIWASLWADQQTQNDGWVDERAKSNRVMYDILHNGSFVSVGKPIAAPLGEEVIEASHKETPLSDTMFNEPELGTETNAYADMPEKVRGDEAVPSLEELAPQMFEKEASEYPDVVTSRWLLGYIDKINYDQFEDNHRIEEFDQWKKITVPISKLSPDYAFRRSDVNDYAAKEGPYPPIILDPRGNIIDGHHRTAAAAIRGDKTIEAYIPVYPGYGYRFDMMAASDLLTTLKRIRPNVVKRAQQVYDAWEPGGLFNTAEGGDVEFGEGGICDMIAEEIGDLLASLGIDFTQGGQDGDDHAWVVAYNDKEAFGVDIPHQLYERGGGYSWKKVPGVEFSVNDVNIFPTDIDREWLEKNAGAAGPTPEGVEYRIDVLDSRRGELFCMAEAWLNGERIGTVNFNELEMDVELSDTRYYQEKLDEYGAKEWERTQDLPREIFIKYVWVEPQYRRKGIATGMYEKIKQEFPGEKIISSGTTDEGGAMRRKMVERGVLASALFLKNAEYAEQQNQVQHTDHTAIGLTKTLKSNPFHDELQVLNESLGKDQPVPNPALESARTEGQPSAKGEDKVTQTRTGSLLMPKWALALQRSPAQILREATFYQDQFEEGHPARVPAKSLEWEAIERFELENLEGFHQGNYDWAIEDTGDYDEEYRQKMTDALLNGSIEPIIVAQGTNGKFYLWDGNHRVGLAQSLQVDVLPAYVGFQKEPKPKKSAEIAEQEPQAAKQPWEMKRDEYAPRPKLIKDEKGQDIYEDETDEQARERYRKSREWEQDSLGAMSLGKMTPEQAKERGYWTDVDKPSAFKPLPTKLYHVTTNASAVYSQGLKTRHELAMDQGGTGLGGGTDKAISFTTDLSTASGIYRAIIEGIRVLNGKISIQRLIDEATKGVGADRPWINELINWGGAHFVSYSENDPNRWTPGKPYPPHTQAFFEGKKIVSPPSMGTPDEEMGDAEPIGYGWTGGDGKQRHTQYKVKLTPEKLRETTFDFFKTWLTARENAGGHLNPLFFSSNVNALAATPEDEVAILEFKPVPGALGTQESALGEWRVYTGRAVQLVGTVPPNVRIASKYAGLRGTLEYHRTEDVLWIDMFALNPKDRGQGGGRIAWKEFESSVPQDITKICLFAGDTGGGPSAGFWEKMGFSYMYDQESGTEYDQYMWKGVNGHPTPKPLDTPDEEHGYDIHTGAASNIVSGEDVVTYVQKLNKWDRQTAYQIVGLDAGGDYILTPEYDLDKLEAGDDYDPEAAERYAKMKTPFPPIVLNIEGKIRDGNHRVAAAKLRGDKTIAAYEPLDTYDPSEK